MYAPVQKISDMVIEVKKIAWICKVGRDYIFLRFWKTNLEAIFIRSTLGKCLYGGGCDEGF